MSTQHLMARMPWARRQRTCNQAELHREQDVFRWTQMDGGFVGPRWTGFQSFVGPRWTGFQSFHGPRWTFFDGPRWTGFQSFDGPRWTGFQSFDGPRWTGFQSFDGPRWTFFDGPRWTGVQSSPACQPSAPPDWLCTPLPPPSPPPPVQSTVHLPASEPQPMTPLPPLTDVPPAIIPTHPPAWCAVSPTYVRTYLDANQHTGLAVARVLVVEQGHVPARGHGAQEAAQSAGQLREDDLAKGGGMIMENIIRS